MARRIVVTLAVMLAIVATALLAVSTAGLVDDQGVAGPGDPFPSVTGAPATKPVEATTTSAPPQTGSVTGSLSPADGGGVVPGGEPELPGGPLAGDVLARINQERIGRGLPGLEIDVRLTDAAQEWAEAMPDGGYRHSPEERLRTILTAAEAGAISEIIHAPETQCPSGGSCTDPAAQPTSGVLVIDWLRSGDHRSAVLEERWNRIGVGVSCTADGRAYAVVLFASAPDVYVDTGKSAPYDEPRVDDNGGYTCGGGKRGHNPSWRHTPIT